jgi:hypothetical protein
MTHGSTNELLLISTANPVAIDPSAKTSVATVASSDERDDLSRFEGEGGHTQS